MINASKCNWREEAAGGLVGALFVTPAVLGCGVIVFQPLGPSFQAAGIQAAFGATIAAALLRGLAGRGGLHVNAPRATQAALLGGLLLTALQAAEAGGWSVSPLVLMAAAFLALLTAGLFQAALGLLRLGDTLKFVPQPVIAGFVNGFALVILLQQLPYLLGLPGRTDWAALAAGTAAVNPWALSLGLLTAAAVWRLGERSGLVPGPLVGLIGGTLAHHLLATLAGPGVPGPVIGALPAGLPFRLTPPDMAELLVHPIFPALAWPILVTGVTLGVVSSIQSLLSAAAADALLRSRHDSNRELLTQGGANALSALAGGTITGGSPLYTRVAIRNGARTDRANLFVAAALLAAALGLGPTLGLVPVSVMAGVVIVAVLRPDDWTRQQVRLLARRDAPAARAEALRNLGITLAVALLVAAADVLVALAVGMGLSVLLHLRRASVSVVRRTYHGDRVHSLTGRAADDMERLEAHGRAIAVMELHGPVFFGSAENLTRAAEELARGADTLILDLARVNDLESTGVLVLRRLDDALKRDGRTLLLAGLGKGRGLRRLMRDMGFDRPEAEGRVFGDLNSALVLAEDWLLERLAGADGGRGAEVPLREHAGVRGLTQAQFDLLSLTTRRRCFAPGERILAEGETSDSVYFLVRGRVAVEKRPSLGEEPIRVAGIRAGAVFGEMALVTGEPRSADVVADGPVVCYELTTGDMAMLDSLDPAITFTLLRNIATEVTVKMRRLTGALSAMEA